ncbi:MFS transporter [Curtobacterium sp. MCJR17_043]|nr:MFS transporter [Curtobacterium sp. MCJR17_043]WIB35660.1 MFS transporter [Curtobacterium sp. MCJR17_043]
MGTAMPGSRRTLRGNPIATLVAVCFGLFMVGLDATVVSIANPAIAADLGTTFTQLQWITNAYLLALAVFLILGGKLGDRFGRRRMYLIGVVAFALASVAIGLVGTATGVIVFRAVQGLSAALLMPQTLALLRATFPKERFGVAVGVWGGASSVAIAAGPIVAGVLVAALGWESVFFVNAPIALIGLVFGGLVLRESTAPHRGRFDVAGVVLLALGLFGIVLAVVQPESWGWGEPAHARGAARWCRAARGLRAGRAARDRPAAADVAVPVVDALDRWPGRRRELLRDARRDVLPVPVHAQPARGDRSAGGAHAAPAERRLDHRVADRRGTRGAARHPPDAHHRSAHGRGRAVRPDRHHAGLRVRRDGGPVRRLRPRGWLHDDGRCRGRRRQRPGAARRGRRRVPGHRAAARRCARHLGALRRGQRRGALGHRRARTRER